MNKRKVALVSIPIILFLLIISLSATFPMSETSPKACPPPQPPERFPSRTLYALRLWAVMDWNTWTEQQYIDHLTEQAVEGQYEYSATVEFYIENEASSDIHGVWFRHTTYNETAHNWTYGITHFTTVEYSIGDLSAGETKPFTLTDFRLSWVIKWGEPPEYQINGQLTFYCDEKKDGGLFNVRWEDPNNPRSKDNLFGWEVWV